MPLALRYAARSDVGLVREDNEDSGLATGRLLVVADGVGGHAAGEVASRLAVQALSERVVAELDADAQADPAAVLAAAVADANTRIRSAVAESPAREGMGTTLTAVVSTGDRLALAHVGDSRGYLLRDGVLRQLTHDQTYVQALVDEGRITPAEAEVHPARSLILRALGQPGDVEPDIALLDVRPGDRILLCSDGLSGVVSAETLQATLGQDADLGRTAATLVELALRGGGPDNITVIVAEVVEAAGGAPEQSAPAVVGAAEPTGPAEPKAGRRAGRGRLRPAVAAASPAPALPEAADTAGTAEESEADAETLRYAPRPPRRFPRLRRLVIALAVLGVLAVAGWAAWAWTQRQYYVGAQNGQVAIFRGLSQELGNTRVSSVEEVVRGLPVSALPAVYREQVDSAIAASDLAGAHEIVDRLRAAACAATRSAKPTAKPTPAQPTPALPAGLVCTGTQGAP